jgi:hypothetical protein
MQTCANACVNTCEKHLPIQYQTYMMSASQALPWLVKNSSAFVRQKFTNYTH